MNSYYEAPSDKIFNEIRDNACDIWRTYDDTYGYATENIERLNELTNFKDNWGTMVGMFDLPNQMKLLAKLSPEAQDKVRQWL